MTEQEMVHAASEYLRNGALRVAIGVPFMSQCIDLVFENRACELVAVEFKRHDWRRAIMQCKTHLLGADLVYICMPERDPSLQLITLLEEYGIGLFMYSPSQDQVLVEHIPARPAVRSLDFPHEWLRKAFGERLGGNP